jgi:hypothetical protein
MVNYGGDKIFGGLSSGQKIGIGMFIVAVLLFISWGAWYFYTKNREVDAVEEATKKKAKAEQDKLKAAIASAKAVTAAAKAVTDASINKAEKTGNPKDADDALNALTEEEKARKAEEAAKKAEEDAIAAKERELRIEQEAAKRIQDIATATAAAAAASEAKTAAEEYKKTYMGDTTGYCALGTHGWTKNNLPMALPWMPNNPCRNFDNKFTAFKDLTSICKQYKDDKCSSIINHPDEYGDVKHMCVPITPGVNLWTRSDKSSLLTPGSKCYDATTKTWHDFPSASCTQYNQWTC